MTNSSGVLVYAACLLAVLGLGVMPLNIPEQKLERLGNKWNHLITKDSYRKRIEFRMFHRRITLPELTPLNDEVLHRIPTIWPTDGTVTSLFGNRIHPILKKLRFHPGIDISNSKNTDIVATADGTVKYSGTRGGYGKTVVVDHGNGFESRYSHADSLLVETGVNVTRGTVIARMGSTGVSTGEHLHYEVRFAGEAVDPVGFVK